MTQASRQNPADSISDQIVTTINDLKSLKDYPIRQLVNHAQSFGSDLKRQRLETNQVRKFLDALNQIKAKLSEIEEKLKSDFDKIDKSFDEIDKKDLSHDVKEQQKEKQKEQLRFREIETEIVLLKPKLAYAAARQDAVKPLNKVMAVAIDKVHSKADFDRLIQLIESIIAYHKAEGGK